MQQQILEFNVIRLELQSNQPLLITWHTWKLWQHTAPLQQRWAHPGNCCWHSTAKPSPAVPEQVPCAALCPCGKLCWTLAPPELAVPGLLWCSRAPLLALSLTSPPLRCPGWVNSPSTHRMTPVISVKATLIHIGITLWVIFPPILTPHFPEGMKEHTVTDLSSLSELTQHRKFCTISVYPQETDRPTVNANNPLLHTLIRKVPSMSCNTLLFLCAFVFSHSPSYGAHIPSPETNCQSGTPIASSKELHPIFKMQSCKIFL